MISVVVQGAGDSAIDVVGITELLLPFTGMTLALQVALLFDHIGEAKTLYI